MPKNPGAARTLTVLREPTSNTCDVYIADEGITLSFMQGEDGKVACVGRFVDTHDRSDRASPAGYAQAIQLAKSTMRNLDKGFVSREQVARKNVKVVKTATTTTCELEYLGWVIIFSVDECQPLTWHTLLQSGAQAPLRAERLLNDMEMRVLKQRAFTYIEYQRQKQQNDKEAQARLQKRGIQLTLPALAKAS